jgi:spore coat protein A
MEPVTESVTMGNNEIWEIYNFTVDAHPIHIHEVMFRVLEREILNLNGIKGIILPANPLEAGYKDTVIALPGQITRIQMTFDFPGRYVWHCHIVEHEDNEMMRPFDILYRYNFPVVGSAGKGH